jgi:trehalose synthase
MLDALQSQGKELRGVRVCHVNATEAGGGVAELLRSVVPLQRDIGIDSRWYVIEAPNGFFETTKRLHNMLQGEPGELSSAEWDIYCENNERFCREMDGLGADLWVIHDPQPALAGSSLADAHHVWRSHIDTSCPNEAVAARLLPLLSKYEAVAYSLESFQLHGLQPRHVEIVKPAIDPVARKSRPISKAKAKSVIKDLGIDSSRPLVSQVSRFDKWKDPLGVVEAFNLARREVPGLQLALLGVMAARDDPEAMDVYNAVNCATAQDPDVHLHVDAELIGPLQIAAVQAASQVVLQKSLREGFGLSATEAMWHETPVIAGDVGGLRLQVVDGVTGYLVNSVQECALRIIELLLDRDKADEMGCNAKERVREHFLLPRLVRDELSLYSKVLNVAS